MSIDASGAWPSTLRRLYGRDRARSRFASLAPTRLAHDSKSAMARPRSTTDSHLCTVFTAASATTCWPRVTQRAPRAAAAKISGRWSRISCSCMPEQRTDRDVRTAPLAGLQPAAGGGGATSGPGTSATCAWRTRARRAGGQRRSDEAIGRRWGPYVSQSACRPGNRPHCAGNRHASTRHRRRGIISRKSPCRPQKIRTILRHIRPAAAVARREHVAAPCGRSRRPASRRNAHSEGLSGILDFARFVTRGATESRPLSDHYASGMVDLPSSPRAARRHRMSSTPVAPLLSVSTGAP